MKMPQIIEKITGRNSKSGRFSNFFMTASDNKKRSVFINAAKRANEEQRKTYEQAQLKTEIE